MGGAAAARPCADVPGCRAVMALLQHQERNWFSIDYEDDSGLCEVEVVGVMF